MQQKIVCPSEKATNSWQQQIQFPFGLFSSMFFFRFEHHKYPIHSNRNRFSFVSIGFICIILCSFVFIAFRIDADVALCFDYFCLLIGSDRECKSVYVLGLFKDNEIR